MNQQGATGTLDNKDYKDLDIVPTLSHLVELGDKCNTIKKLSADILQKAEKEAAKKVGIIFLPVFCSLNRPFRY